jgi:hypothetical protein
MQVSRELATATNKAAPSLFHPGLWAPSPKASPTGSSRLQITQAPCFLLLVHLHLLPADRQTMITLNKRLPLDSQCLPTKIFEGKEISFSPLKTSAV